MAYHWTRDRSLRESVDAVAVFAFHVCPISDVKDIDDRVAVLTPYEELKHYIEDHMLPFFTDEENIARAYNDYLPNGGNYAPVKYNQIIIGRGVRDVV